MIMYLCCPGPCAIKHYLISVFSLFLGYFVVFEALKEVSLKLRKHSLVLGSIFCCF